MKIKFLLALGVLFGTINTKAYTSDNLANIRNESYLGVQVVYPTNKDEILKKPFESSYAASIRLENLSLINQFQIDKLRKGNINTVDIPQNTKIIISDMLSYDSRPTTILNCALYGICSTDVIRTILERSGNFVFFSCKGKWSKLYMQSPLSCSIQAFSNVKTSILTGKQDKELLDKAYDNFKIILSATSNFFAQTTEKNIIGEMDINVDPFMSSNYIQDDTFRINVLHGLLNKNYPVNFKENSLSKVSDFKDKLFLEVLLKYIFKAKNVANYNEIFNDYLPVVIRIIENGGMNSLDRVNFALMYLRTNPDKVNFNDIYNAKCLNPVDVNNLNAENKALFNELIQFRSSILKDIVNNINRKSLIPSINIINILIRDKRVDDKMKTKLRYIRDNRVKNGFITLMDVLNDQLQYENIVGSDDCTLILMYKNTIRDRNDKDIVRTSEDLKNEWGHLFRSFI